MWQSRSDLKIEKSTQKLRKNCCAVRMEWVKKIDQVNQPLRKEIKLKSQVSQPLRKESKVSQPFRPQERFTNKKLQLSILWR